MQSRRTYNHNEWHPLQTAVLELTKAGELETIQTMVASNLVTFRQDSSIPTLDFTVKGGDAMNLLHYALEAGHQDLANYYCTNLPKHHLSAANWRGDAALHYAIAHGFDDLIEKLLVADVPVLYECDENHKLQKNALFMAVEKGNLGLLKVLVVKLLKDLKITDLREYSNHPSFYDSNGDTLLHIAAEKGCIEIVQFLLANKISVNDVNLNGRTPLLLACAKGFINVVTSLLLNKANVNITDNNNYSALSAAIKIGSLELVQLLLEHGAIIKIPNVTTFAMAMPKIFELLLRYGAGIGKNYVIDAAQQRIIDANKCLLLGTQVNNIPVAEFQPAIFSGAIFDGQEIPIESLGNKIQEISILRCCQNALDNATLNPATRKAVLGLLGTRSKTVGLKQWLLYRFADETFCREVITKTKNVFEIPLELKEQMKTFYSILDKRKGVALIEPISDLSAVSNKECRENLKTLKEEVLRFQKELRMTYDVRNKTGTAIIIATIVVPILIGTGAIIFNHWKLDIPDKIVIDIFIIFLTLVAATLLSLFTLSCLVCNNSSLGITKLQQHHDDTFKLLQQWVQNFSKPESDNDHDMNRSVEEWEKLKKDMESCHSIYDFYDSILRRLLNNFDRDRPLIHVKFAQYSQFFKPYAATPSLFNKGREQTFQFDIESNRLEL